MAPGSRSLTVPLTRSLRENRTASAALTVLIVRTGVTGGDYTFRLDHEPEAPRWTTTNTHPTSIRS